MNRQLLPIGAVGELHIGGVSLPLGLATTSALADRLVSTPDVEVAGARMLRTRDLARMRNDGLIEAPGGQVLLAAGQSVELTDSTMPDIAVRVSARARKKSMAMDAIMTPKAQTVATTECGS